MDNKMRILVCGGRKYNDFEYMAEKLNLLNKRFKFSCMITGGASGADTLAARWAEINNIKNEVYVAKWHDLSAPNTIIAENKNGYYNKNAGFDRNKKMLFDGKPSLVVAFPGGAGTKNMVTLSKNMGLITIELNRRNE